MTKTYTDDGRKFYQIVDTHHAGEWLVLRDTHTGFQLDIAKARFERNFREEVA